MHHANGAEGVLSLGWIQMQSALFALVIETNREAIHTSRLQKAFCSILLRLLTTNGLDLHGSLCMIIWLHILWLLTTNGLDFHGSLCMIICLHILWHFHGSLCMIIWLLVQWYFDGGLCMII